MNEINHRDNEHNMDAMNHQQQDLPKRSNEPLYWLGFGAGGMWLAIVSPIMILLVGMILPISLGIGADLTVQVVINFFHTWIGKIVLLGSIALPLWCGMHRIYHLLSDWRLDSKLNMNIAKVFFYGSTIIISLVSACFVLLI